MLATFGIHAPGRELGTSRKLQKTPPPGFGFPPDAVEPPWGWNVEMALCGRDEDFLPGGNHGNQRAVTLHEREWTPQRLRDGTDVLARHQVELEAIVKGQGELLRAMDLRIGRSTG